MNYQGPGEYEHYKGGKYKVIGLGLHENELYQVVIYESLTPGSKLDDTPVKFWVRPLENFNEYVYNENTEKLIEKIPRFKKIDIAEYIKLDNEGIEAATLKEWAENIHKKICNIHDRVSKIETVLNINGANTTKGNKMSFEIAPKQGTVAELDSDLVAPAQHVREEEVIPVVKSAVKSIVDSLGGYLSVSVNGNINPASGETGDVVNIYVTSLSPPAVQPAETPVTTPDPTVSATPPVAPAPEQPVTELVTTPSEPAAPAETAPVVETAPTEVPTEAPVNTEIHTEPSAPAENSAPVENPPAASEPAPATAEPAATAVESTEVHTGV